MNRIHRITIVLLVLAGVLLGAGPIQAQELESDPASVAPGGDGLTLRALGERLAALETESGLSEGERASRKETLSEALDQLRRRDSDLAQMTTYGEEVATAAETIADLERRTAAVMPEDPDLLVTAEERSLSTDELKALATGEDARLGTEEAAVNTLVERIRAEKSRADQIAGEISRAQETIRETESALVASIGAEPGREETEQLLARSRKAAAEAALTKLDLEGRTSAQRLRILQAQLAYETAVQKRAEARVIGLEKILATRLAETVNAAKQVAREAKAEDGEAGAFLKERAEEVDDISAELQRIASRIRRVGALETSLQEQFDLLRKERQAVDKQFELGVGRGAFAQMLIEQQAALPNRRTFRRNLSERKDEITELRFAAFQVDARMNRQPELEVQAGKVKGPAQDQARTLLEMRKDLLVQLEEQYRRLTRELGQLDLLERQILDEVVEFDAVMEEALFWVPSSPVVGLQTLEQVPRDLAWLLGPTRWAELGRALGRMVSRSAAFLVLLCLFLAAVYFLRPRFRREVAAHRVEIRKISSDRYALTLRALGLLVLMAIPLPLLLGFMGQQLAADVEAGGWVNGTGSWLLEVARLTFGLLFLRELCRDEGLGDVHFSWSKPQRDLVRRDVSLVTMVYFPAMWVIMMASAEETSRMPHSLGRLSFVVAMFWVSGCLAHLMRPRDGLLCTLAPSPVEGEVSHRRVLWYLLFAGTPLLLAGLALFGYYYTALELMLRFAATVGILGLAYLLYWLLLRWFMIRERRAALDQLMKARAAKREAAAAVSTESDQPPEAPAAEDGRIAEVEKEVVDLAKVGLQTRRLLRLVVGALTVVGVWFVWADAMPVLRYLDSEPFIGQSTIADILLGLLIGVATVVLARNLQGILEVTVLAGIEADGGLRYAIGTLARYAVVAIGFLAAFEAIGMDWSRFGWMAAALGVGLGFGLQEIVANFVSGIILLFERPIRVGDVVTVGETTGVVSRIRIRATTITDWDRKEFVVPNKEFITGRLLNWTLTNKINRLVIKVGVAYGSDTERVRELLMEIVAAHPAILKDPAPGVTLENFGDSSLDFTIRCYLPDLDRRLGTVHELHKEIHERLAKEGIEIPFPQRDLHLRSGWETL